MQTVSVATSGYLNAPDSNQRRPRGSLRRATRLVTFHATQPRSAYRHLFMRHKVPPIALTENVTGGRVCVDRAESWAARTP
jgi:hypothetical protein